MMQRGRESWDNLFNLGDPFRNDRGFGNSHGPFGGRDPFNDPFFSRPFGSMFGSNFSPATASSTHETPGSKGSGKLIIEELNSDDEDEDSSSRGDKKYMNSRQEGSTKKPSIEHPDDAEQKSVALNQRSDKSRGQGEHHRSRSFSLHSSKVTYGGVDGAYYTTSRIRRTGSDGVVFEESREADSSTGQATHRISRGINDKGHSVTRKLNSDGKVDTMQTLHNLHEDELTGFEEAWRGNSKWHLPSWNAHHDNGGSRSMSGKLNDLSGIWAFPFRESGIRESQDAARSVSSNGQSKKAVRINID